VEENIDSINQVITMTLKSINLLPFSVTSASGLTVHLNVSKHLKASHQVAKITEWVSGHLHDALREPVLVADEPREHRGEACPGAAQHHRGGGPLHHSLARDLGPHRGDEDVNAAIGTIPERERESERDQDFQTKQPL